MAYFNKAYLTEHKELLKELEFIESSKGLKWFSPTHKPMDADQICLNAPVEYKDDPSFGAGYFDVANNAFIRLTPDGNVSIPNLSSKEVHSWVLCDIFIGTTFEKIFNELASIFRLGRVRLMKSKPGACMTWHKDPITRIHYPIKTQPGCLMIIQDEVMQLPLEEWYLTNTTVFHTALNGSKEPRIHLVADLLPEPEKFFDF